jgi:hypothetical protein
VKKEPARSWKLPRNLPTLGDLLIPMQDFAIPNGCSTQHIIDRFAAPGANPVGFFFRLNFS